MMNLQQNFSRQMIPGCNWAADKQQSSYNSNPSGSWLISYVDAHLFDSNLSLTMVADQSGTSIYHVSRFFKQDAGCGFREYITFRRLDKARFLLLTTEESITAISSSVGFDRVEYFGLLFRRHFGLAPSYYRAKYRPENSV